MEVTERKYGKEAVEWAVRDMIGGNIGDNVFFGNVIARLGREYVNKETKGRWAGIPTAAVSPVGNHVTLIVNTDFFDELTDEERVAILIHEVLHITRNHLTRGCPSKGFQPKAANIAMDAAINQHIPTIPEWGINYKRDIPGAEDMPDQPFEIYYKLLVENADPDNGDGNGEPQDGEGQDGEGGGQPGDGEGKSGKGRVIDDHSHFGGDSDTNADLVEDAMKRVVSDAMRSTQAGTISQALQKQLDEFLAPPKVNWRRVLKNWMTQSFEREREMTPMREHIFIKDLIPGSKMKNLPSFDTFLDASGSVDDDAIGVFFSEQININKALHAEMRVHQFDTEVHHTDILRKAGDMPKLVRQACGGTNFQCVIDFARANKIRNLIIFTDGYAPEVDTKGLNVLWVYTPDHHRHPGKGIVLD